jgi:histidine decarboxylase
MKMLTVIADDHPGLLAEVTSALEQAGIDILDFTGQSLGPQAVLSIKARPYREAFRALADAGFRVVSHDHLLVRLEDRPGALAELSRMLVKSAIDVRGMHIVSHGHDTCIVALETAQARRAREVLRDRLVQDFQPP